MARKIVDNASIEAGSGNVFADLDLPDADKLKIKSALSIEITKSIKQLRLTQTEAGQRMGISQAKVSSLLRGEFSNLSERKLMDCLNRLGFDIEITIRPAIAIPGQLRLAIA